MARLFKERSGLGDSKRESNGGTSSSPAVVVSMAADLPSSPFDALGVLLTDTELHETAYEIFVSVFRTTGSRPLTYIPQSEGTSQAGGDRGTLSPSTSSPSLQRSLTFAAASKMKKAMGIKSLKKIGRQPRREGGKPGVRVKEADDRWGVDRVQMRISDQAD